MGYAERQYAHDLFAVDAAAEARAAFIRRTYLHVFGAILAFIGLEAVFLNTPAIAEPMFRMMVGGQWWVVMIGFMAVHWIASMWAQSGASPAVQYLGLGLYVLAEAVIFVPLLLIATQFGSPNLIPTAGIITLLIFGGLTTVVFLTGKDFSFLRGALTIGCLAALGLMVAGWLIGFQLGLAFIVGMIVLMSGFILYDTSNILYHYRTDQHVAAALALFASIATLFWYVIQLLQATDD